MTSSPRAVKPSFVIRRVMAARWAGRPTYHRGGQQVEDGCRARTVGFASAARADVNEHGGDDHQDGVFDDHATQSGVAHGGAEVRERARCEWADEEQDDADEHLDVERKAEPAPERVLLRRPACAAQRDDDGDDAQEHHGPSDEVVQVEKSVVHAFLRFVVRVYSERSRADRPGAWPMGRSQTPSWHT